MCLVSGVNRVEHEWTYSVIYKISLQHLGAQFFEESRIWNTFVVQIKIMW